MSGTGGHRVAIDTPACLPVRRVNQLLESGRKDGWQPLGPLRADEAYREQVHEMDLILASKRGQLDTDQAFESQNPEGACIDRLGHIRVGRCFTRSYDLAGEDDVNSVPWRCFFVIEEQVQSSRVPIDKPGRFQRKRCRGHVVTPKQDVDVLCVSNRGTVDGGNPCGDGIVTGNGVRNAGVLKGCRGTYETLAHLLHGIDHSLKKVDRGRKGAGHREMI
jgi:hypothetical protein